VHSRFVDQSNASQLEGASAPTNQTTLGRVKSFRHDLRQPNTIRQALLQNKASSQSNCIEQGLRLAQGLQQSDRGQRQPSTSGYIREAFRRLSHRGRPQTDSLPEVGQHTAGGPREVRSLVGLHSARPREVILNSARPLTDALPHSAGKLHWEQPPGGSRIGKRLLQAQKPPAGSCIGKASGRQLRSERLAAGTTPM